MMKTLAAIFVIVALLAPTSALAHGGGCRNRERPERCCHRDNSTGGDHCHTRPGGYPIGTSSSSDSSGDVIVAVAVVGLGVWAFSGGDDSSDNENSFISFKTIKADNHIYSKTRQWIGVEHDVSQNFKISLGSFWFVSDDVATILPSADNIGSELVLALGARKSAKGELALTASAFFNDQSANLDDSLRVATDPFGVWDERIAITWRKAF